MGGCYGTFTAHPTASRNTNYLINRDDPNGKALFVKQVQSIALSRLRGYELTGHPALRTKAETGVQTTARQLTGEQQPNFSLCHGLAGNADVLLEASDVLQTPEWRQ